MVIETDSAASPVRQELVQEKPRKGIDRLFKDRKPASAEASADKKDEGGKVTVEE